MLKTIYPFSPIMVQFAQISVGLICNHCYYAMGMHYGFS